MIKLDILGKVKFVNGMLGRPLMTSKEILLLKGLLIQSSIIAEEEKRCIRIFEYGSGHSTIYFAKFLIKQKIGFDMYTIDNNRNWCNKITDLVITEGLKDRVHLNLREFKPFWNKPNFDYSNPPTLNQFSPSSKEEFEYINMAKRLADNSDGSIFDDRFDVIIVDGRFRRLCLEQAKYALKPNGYIFLHDAEREYYHSALREYNGAFHNGGAMFPGDRRKHLVWIGRLKHETC